MNDEEENSIRERSRSYPSYSLSDSLQNADLVKKKLGNYPSSREDISAALGAERLNGATARKIASMVHFGLLRKSGAKYALSDLHQRIIHPLSSEEHATALQEAALRPSLYTEIVERLKPSGGIPEHLRTILIRDFDVLEGGADRASEVFLETIQFAGVVGPDLKFRASTSNPAANDDSGSVPMRSSSNSNAKNAEKTPPSQIANPSVDPELNEYLFNYWDAEGKSAKLYLLREMTQEDMARLKTFLDLQIKITKKPSTTGAVNG